MKTAVFMVVATCLASAAEAPATLVTGDEAEPIHSAVVRQEAWTQDSVRRLRLDADRYMKEAGWSVTSDRPKGVNLDAHEYYSEAFDFWPDLSNPSGPYIRRAGQPNLALFSANRQALDSMCDAVFTLGTAAYLLDDARYAARAAHLVQIWFIASKTRMDPNMDHAATIPGSAAAETLPGGLSEGRPLIRAIQGMEFLAKSGNWDPREEAAARRWFEEYLHWLTPAPAPGASLPRDGAVWRTALEAAAASFAQDDAAQRRIFNSYRGRYSPRTRAASASPSVQPLPLASTLEGQSIVCRIAQTHGVDLWSAASRAGATIANSLDALMAGLGDPKQWSKDQLAAFDSDGIYLMAFAGMGLNKPAYVAEYQKLEKPENAWLALVDLLVGRWEAAAHQTRH
ncbi:MAG TPA: alginate lyase family protein [Bryobacteraceae bacterium]|nr:alginate lyase family protein [Bryobacteraceae bacterium]